MRPHRGPPPALLVLLLASLTSANPFPRDDIRDAGFGYLMDRSCASYCGADNQYCCSSDETCVTSNNIATCTAGSGGYAAYTTTWTETHTYTSTWSSYVAGATTPASSGSDGEDCVPVSGSGQIACGTICCASTQYCAYSGQCSANADAGTWTTGTTVAVVTTAFSAPYRVTGTGTGTTTSATGTAASVTATSTSAGGAVTTTTNNSLSGGAIAGIVVGTIAGVILLLLLCICCIVRGLWHTVLAIFGLGNKKDRKTERTEIIEERYSRHGSARPSAAAARPSHRTWFGGAGGGRPSTAASRNEKKSSGVGWLAAAGGAALLLLGLKRGEKKKASGHKPARSDYSSTYYTDSYTASSPSKSSYHQNEHP